MTSIRKRVGAIFCSFPASVEIVHDIMLQLLLKKDARCSKQSDSEMLESVSVFYCRIKTLGILETWEGSVAKFMLHKS